VAIGETEVEIWLETMGWEQVHRIQKDVREEGFRLRR
jgi:hypothetical protein